MSARGRTVDVDAARTALGAACGDVTDATPGDAVDGVSPALVARPGSTAEVAEVLRAAAAHGLAVVPRGRGTKMTWGRPPERVDVIVDLGRMDAVVDHAAGDLIVEAQAGAPLAAVQETVAGAGQRFALDDPIGNSSVGGALATNLSGPGRMSTGTARDLLIGCTVVRSDGVVAKAGGRVVKNVAGYDLGKLFIGSFGTLAVLTQAVFRLHPLPSARRVVTVPFDRPEEAQRLVQQVLHAQVVPSALEVDRPAEGREQWPSCSTASTTASRGAPPARSACSGPTPGSRSTCRRAGARSPGRPTASGGRPRSRPPSRCPAWPGCSTPRVRQLTPRGCRWTCAVRAAPASSTAR